jgi:hypothetical protein
MLKSTGMKSSGGSRFWLGVFTGVFVAFFFLTLISYYFIQINGVNIAIDQEVLAGLVRDRVKGELAKELPNVLMKVKEEVPKAIAANMDEFDQVSIQIGNGIFPLPPEATKVFKEEFQIMAQTAVNKTVDDMSLEPYVNEISQASYGFVKKTLQDEVVGKTFTFQAYRWLTLPITVQGK